MAVFSLRAKHALISPLTLFVSVWLLCFLLYALHLSRLLVFTNSEVGRMVLWIVAPFVAANLTFNAFYAVAPKKPARVAKKDIDDPDYLEKVEHGIKVWFRAWVALSIVEVGFSGGTPLLWLFSGSPKAYTEFGLPFIHVFVSSLLSVLALAKLGLYLLHGDRRRLFIPFFQVLWSVVIISRGVMVIALIQGIVLWLCLKGTTARTAFRILLVLVVAVLLFGYVGDYRSGDFFRVMAQPTDNYPSWLPSGVLWIYVYYTTPLGNLVNTSLSTVPLYDIRFPNTTYYLFPTPLRILLYGKDSNLGNMGDLVSEVFNVGSAYVGPYKDYGYVGVASFSLLIGLLSAYFWKKRKTFRDELLYSVITQCVVLSIFSNYLFYNPFLGQFFWIYLIFGQRTVRLFPRSKSPLLAVSQIQRGGSPSHGPQQEAEPARG